MHFWFCQVRNIEGWTYISGLKRNKSQYLPVNFGNVMSRRQITWIFQVSNPVCTSITSDILYTHTSLVVVSKWYPYVICSEQYSDNRDVCGINEWLLFTQVLTFSLQAKTCVVLYQHIRHICNVEYISHMLKLKKTKLQSKFSQFVTCTYIGINNGTYTLFSVYLSLFPVIFWIYKWIDFMWCICRITNIYVLITL